MAITALGSLGTNGLATSSTTVTLVPNAALDAGDWIVITVVSNNTSTIDGDNSEVSTVTDTRGNPWTKLGEWTNANGAAGSGLTTSVWMTQLSSDISASNMTVTVTYGSARANKAISAYGFRSDLFAGHIRLQAPVTPDDTDGSNDFGSVPQIEITPNRQVIYFRGLGKQANTTTALTPTSGWTAIANARSSNVAAARSVYGEFIIQDSTGQSSNPTLAVAGNTAGVFITLAESDDDTGETRLTQQHAMVVHSNEDADVRLTQQHAMVVHANEDTDVQMTQIFLMVIHSLPSDAELGWMGNWI